MKARSSSGLERLANASGLETLSCNAFSMVEKEIGGLYACLTIRPTGRELSCLVSNPSYAAAARIYLSNNDHYDIWFRNSPDLTKTHTVRHSDYTSPDELQESDFFQHILKPYDTYYGVSVTVCQDKQWMASLNVLRSKDEGDFNAKELSLLQSWQPAFARAVLTIESNSQASSILEAVTGMAHSLKLPVVILDWDLRVQYFTAVVAKFIVEWRQERQFKTRPITELPLDITFAIKEYRGQVIEARCAQAFHTHDFPEFKYPHPLLTQFSVKINYLPGSDLELRCGVFVLQFVSINPLQQAAMERLDTLSNREKDYVVCIMHGQSIKEAAKHLGISERTARNQLSRIYKKLGVASRVEMVAVYSQPIEALAPFTGLML